MRYHVKYVVLPLCDYLITNEKDTEKSSDPISMELYSFSRGVTENFGTSIFHIIFHKIQPKIMFFDIIKYNHNLYH